MNFLFIFASAADQTSQSNYSKLMEFWRLDKEIEHMERTMYTKEIFHSLSYALMCTRAKMLIKQLSK